MTNSEDRQGRDSNEDREESSGWGAGYPPVDLDKAIDAAREVWDTVATQLAGQRARRAWKSGPTRPDPDRSSGSANASGKAGPSYTVPVSPGRNVTVSGPFPLDESEWEQFLTVLTAMKPALVKATPPTS